MATRSCSPEKFAIIGIGCRMPPGATSLAAFWRFLLRGGNALKSIRTDRWDWRQYWDADPARPGKTYAPKAAWLDADIQQFDPLAFGISPREAAGMDPQQRLLLESAWEAFDDAGLPRARVAGSRTGVFVGGFCLDHLVFQMLPSNRHLVNAHSPAAATMTILSNRISHVFDLRGPSFTLDTACSSSLVALHYACQSLRLGECDRALAGGVNVMSRPEFPILMSKGHFLSHHGECHTFDTSAAGYARGEGAGLFLVRRLSDAVRDGDRIHAVISGSGVNQDGRTDGISLPNSSAQEELMRAVCAAAEVNPGEVDYVEAHGTGTQAGDPAEARALHASFSPGRPAGKKLLVGSVKTNVGHMEAAAGVAGVLKAIGVLKFRQVPKNLHFIDPNPNIPFADTCLEVVRSHTALPSAEEKPVVRVGVNSFGYGGANAHLLLESAPEAQEDAAANRARYVIPFSAADETALRDLAGKMAFQLGQPESGALPDLAYSTAFRRSHLSWRGAVVGGDIGEVRERLIAASTGQLQDGVALATEPAEAEPGLVFVYTGMGPQWWAMGRELIREHPVAAEAVEAIDAVFRELSGWSLRDAMMATESESRMAHTDLAQPANFALQVALTRYWESVGIRPAAVVGHSVGEVAAAHVAGVYTLEDAVRISYHRSRLQQTMAGQGAMLAVGLPEAEAEQMIGKMPGVSVAAVNSFAAVTLSGDPAALRELADTLAARGVFQKFLRVEVAYHSPQMDPLRDELLEVLAGLSPAPEQLPLYSTVEGDRVPGPAWNAEYWWKNVRQPVHFAPAVRRMMEDGYRAFLEVGPHPVLGGSLRECAAHLERKIACFVSLRRAEPEGPLLDRTLAALYCAGATPRWEALAPERGRFLPAPPYPWQRQTHWLESDRSRMERLGLPGPVYLNRTVAGPDPSWEVEINRNYFPFLFDHGVQDQTVFAGMGYVEAAVTLNRRVHATEAVLLQNVVFEKVLIVEPARIQVLISTLDPSTGRFRIASRIEGEEDSVQNQCRGRLLPLETPPVARLDLAQCASECPQPVGVAAFYADLARRGLHYGPAFRPTSEIHVGEKCFFVRIDGSSLTEENDHYQHPVIVDAAIQPILFCAGGDSLYVPAAVEEFCHCSRPGAECYAFGRINRQTEAVIVADMWLLAPDGTVHAWARNMLCQVINTEALRAGAGLAHRPVWRPAPLEEAGVADGGDILVVGSGGDVGLFGDLAEILPGCRFLELTSAPSVRAALEAFAGEHGWPGQIVTLPGLSGGGDLCGEIEALVALLQAAGASGRAVSLTCVTRQAQAVSEGESVGDLAGAALGPLARVAQNEIPELRCRSVDLDGDLDAARRVAAEIAGGARGDSAWRRGERFVSVLEILPEPAPEAPGLESVDTPLELAARGGDRADDMVFSRAERRAPGERDIEVRVEAVGLSARDARILQRRVSASSLEGTLAGGAPGVEGVGVVVRSGAVSGFTPGDRVAALLPQGVRTFATLDASLAAPLPEALGPAVAGRLLDWLTAWRALGEVGRLEAGDRILIENADTGPGRAALEIARGIGAEILATAEDAGGLRALESAGVRAVLAGSPGFDFALREAAADGVDVVLSARGGRRREALLGLLRPGGRYLEADRPDPASGPDLPLDTLGRNLTFASIDIERLILEKPAWTQKALREILSLLVNASPPLPPFRSVPAAEVTRAWAEVQVAGGSPVVLDLSTGEAPVREISSRSALVRADGAYLVTGGTSGFGLATARWLAAQGAGRVVLVSRSGLRAPGMEEALAALNSERACVEVLAADITDPSQVARAVASAERDGMRLRGVIHAAMVLDDCPLSDLTPARFRKVFDPKAQGSLNLCAALRERPDFVVFYSSISSVIGNRGQANYVAANAVLDALASRLRSEGIPAVSINWGALGESGVVARDALLGAALASAGIRGLSDAEAFAGLERAIRSGCAQVGIFAVDWAAWFEGNPGLADDPRFQAMRALVRPDGENEAAAGVRSALADATREQRLRALEEHLQEVLAATLRMPRDAISVQRKLNEMGVDSLLVLELGLGIKDRIGVTFSAMEFLRGPNLQQLAAMAEARLWAP